MRFMLDTNAVVALLRRTSDPLVQRVLDCGEGDIGLSSVVSYELYYGAYRSERVSHKLETLRLLFSDLLVLEFNQEDARVAGLIRSQLNAKGMPIGPYDILIASQARTRDLTLVTNNTGEFERVSNLSIEDWTISL